MPPQTQTSQLPMPTHDIAMTSVSNRPLISSLLLDDLRDDKKVMNVISGTSFQVKYKKNGLPAAAVFKSPFDQKEEIVLLSQLQGRWRRERARKLGGRTVICDGRIARAKERVKRKISALTDTEREIKRLKVEKAEEEAKLANLEAEQKQLLCKQIIAGIAARIDSEHQAYLQGSLLEKQVSHTTPLSHLFPSATQTAIN